MGKQTPFARPAGGPPLGADLGSVMCGRPFRNVFSIVQIFVPFITSFLLKAGRDEASHFLTDQFVNLSLTCKYIGEHIF